MILEARWPPDRTGPEKLPQRSGLARRCSAIVWFGEAVVWSESQLNMSGCETTLHSRRETGWLGNSDCQWEGSELGRLQGIEERSSRQEGTQQQEPDTFVRCAEHHGGTDNRVGNSTGVKEAAQVIRRPGTEEVWGKQVPDASSGWKGFQATAMASDVGYVERRWSSSCTFLSVTRQGWQNCLATKGDHCTAEVVVNFRERRRRDKMWCREDRLGWGRDWHTGKKKKLCWWDGLVGGYLGFMQHP